MSHQTPIFLPSTDCQYLVLIIMRTTADRGLREPRLPAPSQASAKDAGTLKEVVTTSCRGGSRGEHWGLRSEMAIESKRKYTLERLWLITAEVRQK